MKRLTRGWMRLFGGTSSELRLLRGILDQLHDQNQRLADLGVQVRLLRHSIDDIHGEVMTGPPAGGRVQEFDLIQLRWKLEDLEKKLSEAGVP